MRDRRGEESRERTTVDKADTVAAPAFPSVARRVAGVDVRTGAQQPGRASEREAVCPTNKERNGRPYVGLSCPKSFTRSAPPLSQRGDTRRPNATDVIGTGVGGVSTSR
jgi:hypothetical protein